MNDSVLSLILAMAISALFFVTPSLMANRSMKIIFIDFTYSAIVGFFGFILLLVINIKISLELEIQCLFMVGYCLMMNKSGLRELLNS